MTKIHVKTELRIPGKLSYSFFHIPEIDLEVDVPSEYVVGYPDDDGIIYLTPDGLAYLEQRLSTVLRKEKVDDYSEEDIEEGW